MNTDITLSLAIVMLVGGCLAFRAFRMPFGEKPFYLLLLAAFLARAGASFFIQLSGLVPPEMYSDTIKYQEVALGLLRGVPNVYPKTVNNYAWLLAGHFHLFGFTPLAAQIFSGLFGTMAVRNIYRTSEILTGKNAALLIAGIWAVLPSFVFVTSIALRDPIIFFLITTICHWMVLIESRKGRHPLLLITGCFVFAILLCKVRPHQMDLVLMAITGTALSAWIFRRKYHGETSTIMRWMGLPAVLIILFNVGQCSQLYKVFIEDKVDLYKKINFIRGLSANRKQFIASRRKEFDRLILEQRRKLREFTLLAIALKKRTTGGKIPNQTLPDISRKLKAALEALAEINEKVRKLRKEVTDLTPRAKETKSTLLGLATKIDHSYWQFILRIPARAVIYLLSPLPWQTNSLFLKVVFMENLIFLIFLGAGVAAFFRAEHPNLALSRFILLYLLVSLLAYSVAEGNVGTGYRHRLQFNWLFFIPGAAFIVSRIFRGRGKSDLLS
jgi:hypothetical protein